jgi:hypothetical protein
MGLPPSSKLEFRDFQGQLVETFAEWTEGYIVIRGAPETWADVRFEIQQQHVDVRLMRLQGRPCLVVPWPRSNPGHYHLRLIAAGAREEHILTIQPRTISPAALEQMLDDLTLRLPHAVAIGLQRLGGLAGVQIAPPEDTTLAQELVRLQRAIMGTPNRLGLAQTLEQLAQDHHQVLAPIEIWTPRVRARAPHPGQLHQALSRPNNLDADLRPQMVRDRRVEPTPDVYENRIVNAFATHVARRLTRLYQRIGPRGAAAAMVQGLSDTLTRTRRTAWFLDDVALPTTPPTTLTMVLLKRPAYRAALEGYLELHRSLAVRLETPLLDAPLNNLPALYQLWGTMEVVTALLNAGAAHGYKLHSHQLIHQDTGGSYVRIVPNNRPILQLVHPQHGTTVTLMPEWYVGRKGELHSISYPQRPDIAIIVRSARGHVHVYLFDPKYKVDAGDGQRKPIKEDIDKMHAYRDAIRDQDQGRVVDTAAILYPGPRVDYGRGLMAIEAYPGSAITIADQLTETLERALHHEP